MFDPKKLINKYSVGNGNRHQVFGLMTIGPTSVFDEVDTPK